MAICNLCKYNDFVKATIKASNKNILICNECNAIYEFDVEGKPIFGDDPNVVPDISEDCYYSNINELVNIEPYK